MINSWTLLIVKVIDDDYVRKLYNETPLVIPNI